MLSLTRVMLFWNIVARSSFTKEQIKIHAISHFSKYPVVRQTYKAQRYSPSYKIADCELSNSYLLRIGETIELKGPFMVLRHNSDEY